MWSYEIFGYLYLSHSDVVFRISLSLNLHYCIRLLPSCVSFRRIYTSDIGIGHYN